MHQWMKALKNGIEMAQSENKREERKKQPQMNQSCWFCQKKLYHWNRRSIWSAKCKRKSILNSGNFFLFFYCHSVLVNCMPDSYICGIEKWFWALELGLHSNYFLDLFFFFSLPPPPLSFASPFYKTALKLLPAHFAVVNISHAIRWITSALNAHTHK